MKLTEKPTIVNWPETHYVFLEKVGPFQNTAPAAWQELQKLIPSLSEQNSDWLHQPVQSAGPNLPRRRFRGRPPKELPEGVRYEKFKGGKYSKFVLTGPYSQLPAASGRVFELVKQRKSPCAMTPVSRTTSTTRAPHRKTS
jgi:hypothetical protein